MRDTIKKYSDFVTPENVPMAHTPFFTVRIRPTLFSGDPRYGIIAAKRAFKFAVWRNRAKRLIREWLRFNENNLLPTYDYIFIAHPAILDATRDAGRAQMTQVLTFLAKKYGNK